MLFAVGKSKESKLLLRLMWSAVFMSALLLSTGRPAAAGPARRVLILHSYDASFSWTVQIDAGMRAVLDTIEPPIECSVEYMDAKRRSDEKHLEELRQSYEATYHTVKFDAILSSDNDSFNFLRRWRDELFPGAPVFFCGVNFYRDEMLEGLSGFTGIAETSDYQSTIDLMLRLHPATRRILIIHDATTTGKAQHAEMAPSLDVFKERVGFDFLIDATLAQVDQAVSALKSDSLVLLAFFAVDKDGARISYADMARRVRENCPVPVYAVSDAYLGYGIVGGRLTRAEDQGGAAAGMLARFLTGSQVSNIPVQKEAPTRFMFDARELARFGISRDRLPPDSSVIGSGPCLQFFNSLDYAPGLCVDSLHEPGDSGGIRWSDVHVMSRCVARMPVFLEDDDRLDFLNRIGRLVENVDMTVHAFCVMPNHYHLLCETPQGGLWTLRKISMVEPSKLHREWFGVCAAVTEELPGPQRRSLSWIARR